MEYEYRYKDLDERKIKVAEAEGLGYHMLHDNFDKDWKRGEEPRGVMIFSDEVIADVYPVPEMDVVVEINAVKDRLTYFESLLGVSGPTGPT